MRIKPNFFLTVVFFCLWGFIPAAGKMLDKTFSPPYWIKAGLSFGISAQYDAETSAENWPAYASSQGWTSAAAWASHTLQVGQAEIGMGLDAQNGIAFDFNFLQGPEYTANASISQVGFYLNLDGAFQVFGFELSYYRFAPDGDGRFYLKAGTGYYTTLMNYYAAYNLGLGGSAVGNGYFWGDGWGGTLEIGREWQLNRNWGISLFYRERIAVIPRIHQDNVPLAGGGTGNVALVVQPNGVIGLDDPAQIGQDGNRWAILDLSGFDAGFSFDFYLF